MIVQKRPVSATAPSSQPAKRRRRTATQVLAGLFDPRPHHDILTSMFNTHPPPEPSGSILTTPSQFHFDIRTPEHFAAESFHQRYPLFSPKRRRTLQEAQKDGAMGEWVRDNNVMVQDFRIPAPPPVVYAPGPAVASNARDLGGYDRFYSSELSRRAAEPPNPVLPVLAVPGSGDSIYYQAASSTVGRLPYIQTSEVIPSADWPVPGPPSSIASPPTPTRSVSSITSGASSRRLRTPDEGEAPMISTRRHPKESQVCTKQSDSGISNTKHIYADIPTKIPYRAPSVDRASSNGDALTPAMDHGYPNSPPWPPAQQQHIGGDSISGCYDRSAAGRVSTTAPGRILCGPPSPSSAPSYAHRRNALSLAGLLSPVSVPYTSPTSYPFPLPGNCTTSPKLSFSSILNPNNTPVPSSVSAAPQWRNSSPPQSSLLPTLVTPNTASVGPPNSCPALDVAPTAPPSITKDVDMVDTAPQTQEIYQSGNLDNLIESGGLVTSETADKAMTSPVPPAHMSPVLAESPATQEDSVETQVKVKESKQTTLGITKVYLRLPPRETEYDASGASDMEGDVKPSKGKRSRTSKIIESEEEDDPESDTGGMEWVSSSFLTQMSPRPNLTLKRNVGTKRIRTDSIASTTLPDDSPVSASAVSVMGPIRVKRPAAKKGWKGWVEVEVDEVSPPVKAFNPQALPPGERRTRSGKQFDG